MDAVLLHGSGPGANVFSSQGLQSYGLRFRASGFCHEGRMALGLSLRVQDFEL